MSSLQELIDLMKKPSVAEITLVGKALTFAEKAHANHKRFSGEPFMTHLLETAKILAELDAGVYTVAAALLHDTIEDTEVTPEAIKREFGDEISLLVEGVTKLGHLHYRGVDRYSESLRRFLIASSKDLRVLLIKLADRLHNMRTLSFIPESEERERIARETLEIYAPLAYRLGIRKINRELEELSFPYAFPVEHARVHKLVSERQTELTRKLEKFHRSLLKMLAKQDIKIANATHRIKGLYSLYFKLKHREWDLGRVFDTLAVRILVSSVEDCYLALGVIHSTWRPLKGRVKDYIAFPKPNGYRSLHTTVFTGDGAVIEIQIRTAEMNHESEYGVAAHFEFKELERKKPTETSYLERAKQLFEALLSWRAKRTSDESGAATNGGNGSEMPAWIRELGDLDAAVEEREFWERLRNDFFKNRVFIFTPKGDVIDLPRDSTPIDFAYAIHSDIGDHLSGTKINGKLVAIDTPLEHGEIVEILTRENAHPTHKWLELCRTTIAKKHIRNALQKQRPG